LQHSEMAVISQRGGVRGFRSTSLTGNNPRPQGFPGSATRRLMRCSKKLLDHLVGELLEMGRHIEAERLGGLDVDSHLEIDR
jgi:hypothetical protein